MTLDTYADAERDEILLVPLGGAGEIGMNLNLYCYRGRWLMVDLGVAFGDDRTPGVDVMVPDPTFIVDRMDKVEGLVLTHAHEDHLGAVPYLWKILRCPIYATPFACALLRRKLADDRIEHELALTEVPVGGEIQAGPFNVKFISAAHSIPEANILAIRTDGGTVVHATDWKLDPDPLVGVVTDEDALRRLGDDGVLAMVCDSTNVFVPDTSGSEAALRKSLIDVIKRCERRVAVASFASNVARMETVAAAAAATGRHAALVGRSLRRVYDSAREAGYLADIEPFLTEEEAAYLPPENVLMCVTGSQGEPRSALARIASDDHPNIVLDEGDVVIFSSRMIPGNELAIGRLQNQLVRLGVEIITEEDDFVHVSGHPARGELTKMYQWVRPDVLVPIHGEARHLYEQAALAEECQIAHTVVAENGAVVKLGPGAPDIVDDVPAGRLAVDGNRLIPVDGSILRTRQRMRFGGAAVATVVVDRKGNLVADPKLTVHGLIDGEDDDVRATAIDAIADAVEGLSKTARRDDEEVAEATRIAVRRALRDAVGKRPVTDVHVVRL